EDYKGHALVTFSACRLPESSTIDHDKVLRYIINQLDKLHGEEYVLVYFHTGMHASHRPPMEWFYRAWDTISRTHRKSLHQAFVVHPTFWFKMVMGIARTFVSVKVWDKIEYIENLAELVKFIPYDEIDVPALVKHYDKTRNYDYDADKREFAQFGVPLAELVDESRPIPLVMTVTAEAVRETGLEVEGIFRKSGGLRRINLFKERFNQGHTVRFLEEDAIVAANLYKMFLRELPEPLIPQQIYEYLTTLTDLEESQYEYGAAQILSRLPEVNRLCLEHVVFLAQDVAVYSDINMMTVTNLAIVFGPNLGGPADMAGSMKALSHLTRFTKYIFSQKAASSFSQRRRIGDRNALSRKGAVFERKQNTS
ncbi:hypothetical protein SARC_10768, partial [Sphaeroforma arctica JP610]